MASSSKPKLPKSRQIKGIIGGPKTEVQKGKKKETWYKVRWSESYESASKISANEIKRYLEKQRGKVVVLGPYLGGEDNDENTKATKKSKSVRDMDFAVQMQDKILVMSYAEVREQYKDELFEYFEKHASVSDDDSA